MNLSNEITFFKNTNTIPQTNENRVIILTEEHTSKEAHETCEKILKLVSLNRVIMLDEGINAFHSGINDYHLPLEDLSIKELASVVMTLRDLRIFNARKETGSHFIRERINNENTISKYGIHRLKSLFNTFHSAFNSFRINEGLKTQLEDKFNQEQIITTIALRAVSERTFSASAKLYKDFSSIEDTPANDENVESLINIANAFFNSMPEIIYFYTTFLNVQVNLILKSSPEYRPFFENISKIFTNEIPYVSYMSTMRNVGMAKNIHSALNKFDSDIVVKVGEAHTEDCEEKYQTSIATFLQKNHNIKPERIVHQFVGPGFNLEAFLNECNFKFYQT